MNRKTMIIFFTHKTIVFLHYPTVPLYSVNKPMADVLGMVYS